LSEHLATPPFGLSLEKVIDTPALGPGEALVEVLGARVRGRDPRGTTITRGTRVRLTRRGKRVIDRAVEAHVANDQRLLGALTAAERRTLDRLLRSLLVELERPTRE
jgi:hypothetical protein